MRIGIAICGSFCTLSRTVRLMRQLRDRGDELIPIFSYNVSSLDTRFYKASDLRTDIENISGQDIIDTIDKAEPIGPKHMCDIMVVLPCTGNTLSKLAHGITDTPTTMAVKSHLRNNRPVVIALATNDGLGASYENIAKLTNTHNYYFVPYAQDDSLKKPKSLVYREDKVIESIDSAMGGIRLPILDE